MTARRVSNSEGPKSRRRPATTPEGRENQLVSLAVDLAESQLRDGTASAMVITHYLKLGSTREQLEQERLRNDNELLKAKVDTLANAANIEVLYKDAIEAITKYRPQTVEYDA